jgi:hypothetical protein
LGSNGSSFVARVTSTPGRFWKKNGGLTPMSTPTVPNARLASRSCLRSAGVTSRAEPQ